MASPETPLLTAIALSDCWSAGWLLLRSASDWQPPAEITDELCGKYGWLGRRAAMRRIAGELSGNADPNLRRAAKLLAADPADAEVCREIAEMLTEELYRHNLTDAAADAIKGWGALARGLGDAAEPDPIKAARLAYEATLGRRPAVQDAPSPEESAPVLDDWELIEFPGHRAVRGMISGSVKYEAGQIITTSAVRKNDLDMTWVRTRNSIYRLGYRLSDRAPIIRAALKRTRNDAYNLTYGITGAYTLSKEVRDSARVAGDGKAGRGEKYAASTTVACALSKAGRKAMSHAWYLLAADDDNSCKLAYSLLAEAVGNTTSKEVKTVVMGWQMIAAGHTAGEDMLDPIAAAHRIGDRHMQNDALLEYDDPPKEPPGGVMVIPAIGGTKETSGGKEAIREFKDIVGKRLRLVNAPDMVRVRAVLHDEFPHAHTQIDVLLTGMATGDPIRWRNCLITGSPGAGKSRLVRRLSETLGVGLHRFDAAGSSDNAFSGTPRRWATGEPCIPLEAVRRYKIANPLVMVDEIDKGSNSRHNGSAENSLQPFLEPETARAYPDPYVERDIDVSNVGYLLTCNEETSLPGPLRDRLLVVRMPDPKVEHMPALVRAIVWDIGRAHGDPRWVPMLDDGELMVAEGLWRGGSVRRLLAIVERILAYRESKPRN
jgi:hypothetical protein